MCPEQRSETRSVCVCLCRFRVCVFRAVLVLALCRNAVLSPRKHLMVHLVRGGCGKAKEFELGFRV